MANSQPSEVPEGRRGILFPLWVLAGGLFLYVVSLGPVAKLVEAGYIPGTVVEAFYAPLEAVARGDSPQGELLRCYVLDVWRVRHGHGHSRVCCAVNLRAIEGAKSNWALENRKTTNDVPTDADLFGEDRYIREKPQCPENGIYRLGRVSEKPTCSVRAHTY